MGSKEKIALACDHGGYQLKQAVMTYLSENGFSFEDFGTFSDESCDYPDYAAKACTAVIGGGCDKAILVCGTGIGMSIAANKIRGIRAAVCTELFSAEFTRRHNDANVLCLGQRVLKTDVALQLVEIFLKTPYEGGRHAGRLAKIAELEK